MNVVFESCKLVHHVCPVVPLPFLLNCLYLPESVWPMSTSTVHSTPVNADAHSIPAGACSVVVLPVGSPSAVQHQPLNLLASHRRLFSFRGSRPSPPPPSPPPPPVAPPPATALPTSSGPSSAPADPRARPSVRPQFDCNFTSVEAERRGRARGGRVQERRPRERRTAWVCERAGGVAGRPAL